MLEIKWQFNAFFLEVSVLNFYSRARERLLLRLIVYIVTEIKMSAIRKRNIDIIKKYKCIELFFQYINKNNVFEWYFSNVDVVNTYYSVSVYVYKPIWINILFFFYTSLFLFFCFLLNIFSGFFYTYINIYLFCVYNE